jgi:hypothetical protein
MAHGRLSDRSMPPSRVLLKLAAQPEMQPQKRGIAKDAMMLDIW